MANDLIPPPSPAGRPQPAGTPRLVELPPEPTANQAEASPKAKTKDKASLPPSRFRNRFGFLMGALGGIVIASLVVLGVVLATSDGSSSEDSILAKNWSKWQPQNTTTEEGAQEIAEKVGAEYTHPNGQALNLVTGGQIPDGLNVAVRPATGPVAVFEGPGVLYNINGLGPNGSIKGGTPSAARLKLIHREALELALYTFRYLPDVKMVVTLLPPPPPEDGEDAATTNPLTGQPVDPNNKTAIFYRPGDLKPQLQTPLGVTVPAKAPNPDTMSSAPEAKTIDTLTQSNIFKWSVSSSEGAAPVLLLDR